MTRKNNSEAHFALGVLIGAGTALALTSTTVQQKVRSGLRRINNSKPEAIDNAIDTVQETAAAAKDKTTKAAKSELPKKDT